MSDAPTARIDRPAEGMHQLNANSQNAPRFPRSVVVAGVIWIALGVLGVVSAVFLLLLGGIDGSKLLPALCSPILLLFGVLFLLAGFRVVCGAERGMLANGVTSLATGAWFLINVFNACYLIVSQAFLLRNFSIGRYGDSTFERDVILAPPQLLLGLLLLTAGRLALAGGSQYTQWREAQIDRRRREEAARKA